MKILITGSNSFIGTNYRKYSQFNEINEISLIENSPGNINLKNYDVVLHLAALVHQKKKISDDEYFRINKDLAVSTAIAAKKNGVNQFVFMSTLSVYGDPKPEQEYFDEFSQCQPQNAYGKSKLEAEYELKKLDDSNFCVSIIRTPLVYGENVIANMLSLIKLINKFKILPFGNVKNKRSYTAVENLVEYIDLIIVKKKSGIFIACDQQPLSTTELVRLISKNLEKKVLLFKLPFFLVKLGNKFKPNIFDKLYGSFVVKNNYTVNTLGYKPKISTEDAIKKMIKVLKG